MMSSERTMVEPLHMSKEPKAPRMGKPELKLDQANLIELIKAKRFKVDLFKAVLFQVEWFELPEAELVELLKIKAKELDKKISEMTKAEPFQLPEEPEAPRTDKPKLDQAELFELNEAKPFDAKLPRDSVKNKADL